MKRTLLIAATSSGSGKTTLTIGLLRALSRRGLRVQPFKCGPDYIDPQYHHIACGTPSVNLDLWMNGKESVRRLVEQSAADINIVEGAMGLYDGADGMQGSAAEVAETIGADVILVVDGRSMAHSAAPLLYGYLHWRPETHVRAVIFNNVGSERHAKALRLAAEAVGIECLGCIPRQKDLYSPSRHLGLDIMERERISALADKVADAVEPIILNSQFTIHNSQNLSLASCEKKGFHNSHSLAPYGERAGERGFLYLARDEAFNFCYHEAEQILSQHFRIKYFSPLANEPVGDDAVAVYLPGGYPELFAQRLSQSNVTMDSLRRTKARIVAECGGMMYLSQAIDDTPLTGLLPFSTTMEGARLHLGYRQMQWNGTTLRGHEFHYSKKTPTQDTPATEGFRYGLLNAQNEPVDTFIYAHDNILASYVHWSPESLLKLIQGE